MAAEAIAFLYEHLCEHEQWTAAAHLLAFALPTSCRMDPRVIAAIRHAATVAETLDTPEKELIHYRGHVHQIDDDFVKGAQAVTQRGAYWIRATRLFCAGAGRAAEFGSGCGSNVMHATKLGPEIEWTGIDASKEQIDWCRATGERLGIRTSWATDPDESLFGAFDSIAILDVLEHTAHPLPLIERAEKYLRPGGIVTISMPRGPWSLHTRNDVSVGNHVNVTTIGMLAEFAEKRGRILSLDLLAGPVETESNASALVTFQVAG